MVKHILALEKDLFFSVKMRDTLRHHEMEVTIARTLSGFLQHLQAPTAPDLVIVNIATPGVDWEAAIRQARASGLPVLAFGSHMDLEARAKALQAGAQRVVANSKFTTDMPALVQRMLSQPAEAPTDEPDDDVEA
ncbi:MAG: response regulator transcription factor [Ktedonobacteraceae bacterium]|nr:response regulator transcription factor [Ktedonobacteraceae bacterium]